MNDDLPGAGPEARWYSVSDSGQAMLCADEEGALQNSAISNAAFQFHAPYRAVQLVDVAAVAAERERCAAIARRWGETHAPSVTVNARNAADKIARGIEDSRWRL